MEAQAIYRKSDKGVEAIATRGHGVGGKLRMLLILVDGKKTVEELGKLAAGMGESVQLLEQLETQGLIEALAVPTAAATPGRSGPDGADLAAVKLLATRRLVELLGPQADELAMKIEAAKDLPQLVDALKRSYSVLREIKGDAVARRFGEEVEAQLPAA